MISIIIATFNSSRTLAKALESVLEQNFNDWECIIVDGKSTDNTLDIIKEFELKDSRFSHVSEKDNGIYDAFNKGWKMAKGEWIYYLGSDDYLTGDGLKKLASVESPEVGLHFCKKQAIGTGGWCGLEVFQQIFTAPGGRTAWSGADHWLFARHRTQRLRGCICRESGQSFETAAELLPWITGCAEVPFAEQTAALHC